MIPGDVPKELQHKIVKNSQFSAELLFNDRSFVYSKVAKYQVVKCSRSNMSNG